MCADVAGIPVVFVREENDARFLVAENFGNDGDAFPPMRVIVLARFGVNFFEAVRLGLD